MSVLSIRYSEALFEVALETEQLDEVFNSLQFLNESLSTNLDFVEVLMHPEIELVEKLAIIDEVFTNINQDCKNFLKILVEKRRISEFKYISADFNQLFYDYKRIKIAKVYSAIKLTKAQLANLNKKLCTKYDCEFVLENHIDESLLAGIRIKIGNQVIDDSVKTRLNDMKNELYGIRFE